MTNILLPLKIYYHKVLFLFKKGLNFFIGNFAFIGKRFRLPVFIIRDIKKWTVTKDYSDVEYSIVFNDLIISPVEPKCPACVSKPAPPVEISPNKRFNYWDTRSGFDSRNGFYYRREIKVSEVFLLGLSNATIVGSSGSVITSGGGLVAQSLWTWDSWVENDRTLTSLRLPEPKLVQEVCYSVVTNYYEGYPHWLMEALPRLYALESLHSGTKPTLIFNAALNKWQEETIQLLGFGTYPRIYLNQDVLKIGKLYLPGYVGIPGTPHPLACKWLRDKIIKGETKSEKLKRIYISRKYATKRKVLNEDAVMKVLSEFGFIEVFAENYSFAEQVELFRSAEAVVASHGAGLANLLFVPGHCKVLEILDKSYVSDYYYNLSGVLELDYYYMLCDSVKQGAAKIGWDHIEIEIEKLRMTLNAMFP